MECASSVLLTIFGHNCHTVILITSRKAWSMCWWRAEV